MEQRKNHREIRKYFLLNDNNNTTDQNQQDVVKEVLMQYLERNVQFKMFIFNRKANYLKQGTLLDTRIQWEQKYSPCPDGEYSLYEGCHILA